MSLGTAFPAGFQAGSSAVDRGLAARDRRTQMEQEEQAKKIESHNKRKEQFVKMINEFVKGTHAKDPENAVRQIGEFKRSKAISQQMQLYAVMDQVYGQNPTVTLQQFENAFNQPSPQQLAEEKAATESIVSGAKTKADAEAVSKGRNFFLDGDIINVSATDTGRIEELRKTGAFEIGIGIQAAKLKDVKPTPKDVDEAGETLGAVQTGASAIKALTDVPGAAGIPGMITDTVGGFFGSIGAESVENMVSHLFSGDAPEKVKAARSKFITFQGSMARSILNDTRISDYERRILNEAIGATGPKASSQALIGAYKQILATATTVARRKQIEAGQITLDLSKPEDINELGRQLTRAGLTNKDAVDVIKQILDIEAINLRPQ